jgi:hypothetical protein
MALVVALLLDLTLVKDGQARAVIVPAPGADGAARLLREHLARISGATLPLDASPPPASEERPWIRVDVAPAGVLLRARGHVLELLGEHAVTAFLEEKLDVRYLWPGELGKVIPRRATIVLPEFESAAKPLLPFRRIRMMEYHDRVQEGLDRLGLAKDDYVKGLDQAGWSSWQWLGGALNLVGGHAFDGYGERYGKEHPEWFALQPDGTRDRSKTRVRLCKSNPELIAQIAANKIAELRANPALLGVSISPSDGGRATFCVCAKCEALDAPDGPKVKWGDVEHVSYTDRLVWFSNAIAERVAAVLPDKLLVFDVYSVYSAPPLQRALHPNIVLRYANLGGYHDEATRRRESAEFDAWAQAGRRFFWRPNLLMEGRRTGFPLISPHRIADDFRRVVKAGAIGFDFDCVCHHWATQGLNYYVVARLLGDPERDVDAIIDDYCRAGFGAGAASVRRYFDLLEAERAAALEAGVKQVLAFKPEAIARLRAPLEKARAEIGQDRTSRERLAFLELGLRWTEVEAGAYAAGRNSDERRDLMREIFRTSPRAVNVAYVAWGGLWR